MTDTNEKFLAQVELNELAEAMDAKYRIGLNGRSFAVEAKIEGIAVYVKVTLEHVEKTFVYPAEARIDFKKEEMTANEAVLFLIDYIDTYFEEFLLEEDEELYLPIDWSKQKYEAVEFEVRGQIKNEKLEDMADDILKKSGFFDEPQ